MLPPVSIECLFADPDAVAIVSTANPTRRKKHVEAASRLGGELGLGDRVYRFEYRSDSVMDDEHQTCVLTKWTTKSVSSASEFFLRQSFSQEWG